MITDQDMNAAVDRIARTSDGLLLYRWLQMKLMEVLHYRNEGALQVHEGGRIFALGLMARMCQGIDASAGRTDNADGKPSERPVIVGKPESAAVKRTSYRDWAIDNDPELAGSRAPGVGS